MRSLSLGALAATLVAGTGCAVDDSTADTGVASEDSSETVAQSGQRLEAALQAAADRSGLQAQIVRGATNPVVVPVSVPGAVPLDIPAADAAGTPPTPPADPKTNQGTSDQGGTTQMDPEPCPWSQKNGSTN